MAAVVERLADVIFVTSDNPRTEKPEAIISDIMVGFRDPSSERLTVEPDRRKAIELAIEAARPDDIVLLAGKGHETYQIIGDKKFDFSDKDIAQRCLREHPRSILIERRLNVYAPAMPRQCGWQRQAESSELADGLCPSAIGKAFGKPSALPLPPGIHRIRVAGVVGCAVHTFSGRDLNAALFCQRHDLRRLQERAGVEPAKQSPRRGRPAGSAGHCGRASEARNRAAARHAPGRSARRPWPAGCRPETCRRNPAPRRCGWGPTRGHGRGIARRRQAVPCWRR